MNEEKRYIDANALKRKIDDVVRGIILNPQAKSIVAEIEVALKKMPTEDAVVHGHWIICSDGYYPYCSCCTEEPPSGIMKKNCPNCGARMDLEE